MCPPCPRTCVHHVSGPYKKRQSNQSASAPSYGLRCAQVPSLRLCSVGPLPRAIHGPSRLSRHPCRSTHSTEPPLALPGGLADQKHCAPRRPTGRPAAVIVYCTISVAADEERRLRSSAATTRPRLAYRLKCKRHLKGAFAVATGDRSFKLAKGYVDKSLDTLVTH